MIQREEDTCSKGKHPWISTTASNFRKCGKSKCGATQRLQDGIWVEVETVQIAKVKKSNKLAPSSLCEDTKEHDWTSTTAANYRKCCRYGCTATQQFIQGTWVDTGSAKQQASMFPNNSPQTTIWPES